MGLAIISKGFVNSCCMSGVFWPFCSDEHFIKLIQPGGLAGEKRLNEVIASLNQAIARN
jgi:hypothetical protein